MLCQIGGGWGRTIRGFLVGALAAMGIWVGVGAPAPPSTCGDLGVVVSRPAGIGRAGHPKNHPPPPQRPALVGSVGVVAGVCGGSGWPIFFGARMLLRLPGLIRCIGRYYFAAVGLFRAPVLRQLA